jgi:UDP-glucose 4-epimerase
MKILLTGASGLIGDAFVRRNRLNAEIISLGRQKPTRADHQHISADLGIAGEIERLTAARALPQQLDLILHLAVSRHHRTFPDTALDMFYVNVATTVALLDYARKAGASQVIVGSTGTVYYPFPNLFHKETDATQPQSYFGYSKFAAEVFAGFYSPFFSVFIPRFFTPYGPGQNDRLVDGLIKNVLRGAPVSLPLEGRGLRTAPLYVADAAWLLEEAIANRWSGVFNVAGDEVLALQDMAEIIGEASARKPVFQRSSHASSANLVPDLGNLRTKADLSKFTRFEQGIRRTLEAV